MPMAVAVTMSLTYDSEFAAAMGGIPALLPPGPKPAVGDALGRRARVNVVLARVGSFFPNNFDVNRTDHEISTFDGSTVIVAKFRRQRQTTPSKTIYYIHGGGMITGNIDSSEFAIKKRVEDYDISIFAIGYRLAPEHPHPTPVLDCYAGLNWLSTHAAELGVDATEIIVHGESAGGGLAAGIALMARDNHLTPPVCKLVLNSPMLDDRNRDPMPDLEPFATWTCDDNLTGWTALLGDAAGSLDHAAVSVYAAPARAKSLAGLPRTYVDCGQLDIFLDEDQAFVTKLIRDRVPVEYHIYPGMPHAFSAFAPNAVISRMAIENLQRAFETV